MNRSQYTLARLAAFQARRAAERELSTVDHADSPSWLRNQILSRSYEVISRVPSPFSMREHQFLLCMAARRERIRRLLRDRTFAVDSTHADRITRDLRDALRAYRANPISVPVPLPAAPFVEQLKRAA
jgi:hypothetical protein